MEIIADLLGGIAALIFGAHAIVARSETLGEDKDDSHPVL